MITTFFCIVVIYLAPRTVSVVLAAALDTSEHNESLFISYTVIELNH